MEKVAKSVAVNLQTISEKFANYLRKLERAIFWEQLTGSPQKAQF